VTRARSAAWLGYGIAIGISLRGVLDYLDAVAQQYVRVPGSPRAVRVTGRKPA
jgi:hypothetical protein